MKQTLNAIILFVKNALTMKRDFAIVHVYNAGVQYSQDGDDECGCGSGCGCSGNCNC